MTGVEASTKESIYYPGRKFVLFGLWSCRHNDFISFRREINGPSRPVRIAVFCVSPGVVSASMLVRGRVDSRRLSGT